jgi:hypothetical protein
LSKVSRLLLRLDAARTSHAGGWYVTPGLLQTTGSCRRGGAALDAGSVPVSSENPDDPFSISQILRYRSIVVGVIGLRRDCELLLPEGALIRG